MESQQCEQENQFGPDPAVLGIHENSEEQQLEEANNGSARLHEVLDKPIFEVGERVSVVVSTQMIRETEDKVPLPVEKKLNKKRRKKLIFISYSSDSGFLERKFVCETVRQLKENNLAEDIWFDKDEGILCSPLWLSHRLDAIEKCRAAIVFLSEAYFECPVTVLESKILFERSKSSENPPKVFPILFTSVEIPKSLTTLFNGVIDLTGNKLMKTSLAEKCSLVIGNLSGEIDKYSFSRTPFSFNPPCVTENNGEFRRKSLVTWRIEDIQEWLVHIGIREFYQQAFAENAVDGYLLLSLTDESLSHCLGVESRAIRRKVLNQRAIILDREHKRQENWHLAAQAVRMRPNSVYLIYDPADAPQAEVIMMDMRIKGFQVLTCTKLGQSKEDFLQTASPLVASAKKIVLLLSESAAGSPFVYQLVIVCQWMKKVVVIAMFKNCWQKLRPTLKAILGDMPAVDCEGQTFKEAMNALQLQLSPPVRVRGVILEQAYLDRIAESAKTLKTLISASAGGDTMEDADRWCRSAKKPSRKINRTFRRKENDNVTLLDAIDHV